MEIVLAILALAGALWGLILMVRGGLVVGALLSILAGSCFGHPFFKLALGPLPITSDRVLLVILALQYVVLRRWGCTDPKPPRAADWVLAAFFALLSASTLLSDWKYHNSQPMAQYLFLYALPMMMYWIVRRRGSPSARP